MDERPAVVPVASGGLPPADRLEVTSPAPRDRDRLEGNTPFELLRRAVEAAATAGSVGRDVAGHVGRDLGAAIGQETAEAARRLGAAANVVPGPPNPARDLGVPMSVLALLGAYLASSRWLDRGGLPMIVADGQGDDDVQLDL